MVSTVTPHKHQKERKGKIMPKKRVVFTFDERSMESLQAIKEKARSASLGDAVKESLQVSRTLHEQAENGFVEVVVRNPQTKEERVLVIPSLQNKK
jgi:metal-responsive CopG/Arc/MetJ family transcriptional regulator